MKRKTKKFTPREITIRGQKLWQIYVGSEVRKHPDGRRVRVPKRKIFADRSEANQYAELLRIQRANHGAAAMTISSQLRDDAIRAAEILQPYPVTLTFLAEKHVREETDKSQSRAIEVAVADYIAGAKADGRRPRYVWDLTTRLRRFARDFSGQTLAGVSTSDLERWLRALGVGAVSRNSYRRRLVALFGYGADRGWCPGNPALKVAVAKEDPAAIGILSPDEFARLLGAASEPTLPYWAIGGFAGIRSAELERLTWKDVHWDSGLIEISASNAKTAARRFTHMQPALKAWLEPYRNHHGPICPATEPKLRKFLVADRIRAGILKWPSNALRHSFASYHLERFRSAGETALELGHSNSSLIFKHYRELVTPTEVAKWWSIIPLPQNKIVAIA